MNDRYGGRYLKGSDIEASAAEWPYYLCNYVLRHLLEFHFLRECMVSSGQMDLVLDRVGLSEAQHKNSLDYLNSRSTVPLRKPFSIPQIVHLTEADSRYVGGLQIAHLLAEVVKEHAKGSINGQLANLTNYMSVEHFLGQGKRQDK